MYSERTIILDDFTKGEFLKNEFNQLNKIKELDHHFIVDE
jgi:hypothetical protein